MSIFTWRTFGNTKDATSTHSSVNMDNIACNTKWRTLRNLDPNLRKAVDSGSPRVTWMKSKYDSWGANNAEISLLGWAALSVSDLRNGKDMLSGWRGGWSEYSSLSVVKFRDDRSDGSVRWQSESTRTWRPVYIIKRERDIKIRGALTKREVSHGNMTEPQVFKEGEFSGFKKAGYWMYPWRYMMRELIREEHFKLLIWSRMSCKHPKFHGLIQSVRHRWAWGMRRTRSWAQVSNI